MSWRDRQRESQTATLLQELRAIQAKDLVIGRPSTSYHKAMVLRTARAALPLESFSTAAETLDHDWCGFPSESIEPAEFQSNLLAGPRVALRRQLRLAAEAASPSVAIHVEQWAGPDPVWDLGERARARGVSLGFDPSIAAWGLADPPDMAIRHADLRVDLSGLLHSAKVEHFPLRASRIVFEERREPNNLFHAQAGHGPRGPRTRVKPVDVPPADPERDINSRIRDLLTPPVDDLLADPQLCLPEQPFPYQMQGIGWLLQRKNALLADEMGLGKTMQAIVAARLLWKQKSIARILIVCPKSLIGNWRTEIVKWWPQIAGHIRRCEGDRQWFLRLATDNMVFKIINYEAIAKEADWLANSTVRHDLIIIDEAQRIKNPASATARAVKSLKSDYRWALTGTPLENRIEDLLSIFEFVKPGLLRRDDQAYLKQRIPPYMLRRRTEEVLLELPERLDLDVDIELGPRQRRAYDQAEREGVMRLNEQGDSVTITHVFQLISSLRQICNFDPISGQSAKLERLREDLEDILPSGRKVLIFSQFTGEHGIERIERGLGELRPIAFHGKVPANRRDALVHEFNVSGDRQLMLLNYAVGGVGLNLQAANYVYLFDRWWNPAVEDQAVKRAHRIGQKGRVFVLRFVCTDTIEERILQKLREKRALFEAVIDESRPDKAVGLSEEEILGLFPGLTVRPQRKGGENRVPRLVMENLDPQQFEVLVSKMYEAHGYSVQLTGRSADGGIDLVAELPERECVIVQCKHWRDRVGVQVVRELWGAVHADPRFTRGDLVVSSAVSRDAHDFARGKRLRLLDGEWLRREAQRLGIASFVDRG